MGGSGYVGGRRGFDLAEVALERHTEDASSRPAGPGVGLAKPLELEPESVN